MGNEIADLEDRSLVIRRLKTKKPNIFKYIVVGMEDLPMNRHELVVLLRVNGTDVENTALMFAGFNLDGGNEAHFGIFGELLFVTTFKQGDQCS